jgi:hypothetical protein
MKTLIAAVAFAAILGAPAFAQSGPAWAWKGASAAPAGAKSAYAAAFNNRRGALSDRRAALSGADLPSQLQCFPREPILQGQLQLTVDQQLVDARLG